MEAVRVVYDASKTVEATSDLKAVTQELTLLSLKSMTDRWLFEKDCKSKRHSPRKSNNCSSRMFEVHCPYVDIELLGATYISQNTVNIYSFFVPLP